MQAYLKSGYGVHICSECGQRYDSAEYISGYSLRHILTATVKCKRCGAILSEPPKRCYYSDYHSGENACTECMNLNGNDICTQQTTKRKQELLSWGYYYKCPYYKPKEPQQLSFWEV
jgi:hypothetical protein